MSKSPFVVTLVVCGTLLGWLYGAEGGIGREEPRPAGARALSRVYGYPDPRGIRLEVRESATGTCPASIFRSESPDFVLWDDGTIVYRNSTYDYKQGRISHRTAQGWMRTLLGYTQGDERVTCDQAAREASPGQVELRSHGPGGVRTLTVQGYSSAWAGHAEGCADCRPIRPLVWMIDDIHRQCYQLGGEVLAGPAVEVYLEYRSCGCRNHPDIVAVSREWPLSGPKPHERCGTRSTRFVLTDLSEIRALGEALSRSAAVLDGPEIYTCFMRPLLDASWAGELARR
jgi:hypothetical protein